MTSSLSSSSCTIRVYVRVYSLFVYVRVYSLFVYVRVYSLFVYVRVYSDVNKRTVTPGNSKCQSQGCQTCSIITTSDTFTSNTTKKTYKIKGSYNCKTSNVIYLIQCTKCGMQYVGETGQCLHQRMNNHRADVTNKRLEGKPVGRHFNKPQHSVENMKVTIIDYLGLKDDLSRKCRESKWIRKLVTFDPYGLNIKSDIL